MKLNFQRTLPLSIFPMLILMLLGRCVATNMYSVERNLLSGTWQLASITYNLPQRTVTNPKPQPSLFIFTDGYYSIAWNSRPEQRLPFSARWQPTDEELKSAYSSILVNSGSYDLVDSTLTTHPIISKVPEQSGGKAVYRYRTKNDTLWLTMIDEYAADGTRAPWVGKRSFPLQLLRLE